LDTVLIDELARLCGIGAAYHDYRGELHHFTSATKVGLLRAMGLPVDDPAALEVELARLGADRCCQLLLPLAVTSLQRVVIEINVPASQLGLDLHWAVRLENGERFEGTTASIDCPENWRGDVQGRLLTRRRFEPPLDLPQGYHELEMSIGGAATARCLLIASPSECHEPAAIREGRRLWGVAVQLYTVRSEENWGIGDFTDLKALIRWLASRGVGFIGLNPLHALAPADPQRASPYSASSRHFLNIAYIAVPTVPEYAQCAAALRRVEDPVFAQRLRDLRAAPHVDYRGVLEAKLEILELLHDEFRLCHLERHSERAAAFGRFVASRGEQLRIHACFDALDAHFRATLGADSGWLSWPPEYRDPNGDAVRGFAGEHPRRIEFFMYIQWLAHEQLTAAQSLTRELGMPIGLYGDYAVGAHPAGSETWADQKSYRMGAEIGAPPDPLALKGQGWGIPPLDPRAMQAERLHGFIRLIRANLHYYGALRLDHVMSLFRLWWIAAGFAPTEGAYVHYPLEQLLSVLALESARSNCMIVGEDLGVVPDEMRRAMPAFGLYHYKVLLFEKTDGRFRRPDEYVRRALATLTTHDMPTLRSYWEGLDIELRQALNLYPSAGSVAQVRRERDADRAMLLAALAGEGLAPDHPAAPQEPFTPQLAHALHVYLARTQSALVTVQIEDLLGMTEPVNVPGTFHEYPNWQRKVDLDIEEMMLRHDFDQCFEEINRARA
jgi:4-alpha-glucanotransferase